MFSCCEWIILYYRYYQLYKSGWYNNISWSMCMNWSVELSPGKYSLGFKYLCCATTFNNNKNLFSLGTYIISHLGWLLLPVSEVPDVPPLDLQGVGGRARPSEGTSHLYIVAALRRGVVWHLGKKSWKREKRKQSCREWWTEDIPKMTGTQILLLLFLRVLRDVSPVTLLHHTRAREKKYKALVAK